MNSLHQNLSASDPGSSSSPTTSVRAVRACLYCWRMMFSFIFYETMYVFLGNGSATCMRVGNFEIGAFSFSRDNAFDSQVLPKSLAVSHLVHWTRRHELTGQCWLLG